MDHAVRSAHSDGDCIRDVLDSVFDLGIHDGVDLDNVVLDAHVAQSNQLLATKCDVLYVLGKPLDPWTVQIIRY